ncbi:MAG: 2-oxo acid dehydrogenase subunit E2 [Flavobacteriia bacterium]|nr:2-oxo acid dehydrogenase subunit E2 [Flavobacteriia bacterium]
MAEIEIRLPKMGESVTEATITNWLKNIGDTVAMDEPLVEVATDKVDNELPSEAAGVLIKQLFQKDEVAKVGDVIAILSTGEVSVKTEQKAREVKTPSPPKEVIPETNSSPSLSQTTAPIQQHANRFYSPLVKSIAQQEGLSQGELDSIAGTGSEGRVTKKDLLAYLEHRGNNSATPSPAVIPAPESVSAPKPVVQAAAGDEIIEMDRMRKLIADHMVMSKHVSPHVTSFVEADVTNLVNWRNRVKKEFQEKTGENITFTPIFIEAVVITNVGTFGNVMGTPIINQPQVAILALGAIRKVPAVIETSEGDMIAIRQKMFLSHSYDHRVVDGALGGQFVRRVADYLEQFDSSRKI